MITGFNHIREKMLNFYQDTMSMSDVDQRMDDYLHAEIINDFRDKNIKTCEDWFKYYSTDGNKFDDIVELTEAYYLKALQQDYNVTIDEKLLADNVLALYSIEMDVEKPTGKLIGTVIFTFVEMVRHYDLFLKGYLCMRGEVLISNREKAEFFSLWTNGSTFVKEMPITLFTPNE